MENKSPATKKRPQIIDEDYKQSCYILSKEGEKKKNRREHVQAMFLLTFPH